jgi:ubiquinone/menaquinone biosynthesis C-methylase UbiE
LKPDFPVGRLVLVSACAQSEKSRDANDEIADSGATGVTGIGGALPFHDNSLDAVISRAVPDHVRDPFRCAAGIARILKPGGRLKMESC